MCEVQNHTAPNWITVNQAAWPNKGLHCRTVMCKQRTEHSMTKVNGHNLLSWNFVCLVFKEAHFGSWLCFHLHATKHKTWWSPQIKLFSVTGTTQTIKLYDNHLQTDLVQGNLMKKLKINYKTQK